MENNKLLMQWVSSDEFKQYRNGDRVNFSPPFSSFELWCDQSKKKINYVLIRHQKSHEVVGTMIYRHLTKPVQYTKLLEIEIHPEYRGRGFGGTCLRMLIRKSRSIGSLFISLVVFHQREIAKSLYGKLGFSTVQTFEKSEKMLLPLTRIMLAK